MSLAPGSRLGAYEVLSALGAGGMGEVFRARDTRLGREVAIKILPADRVADAQRRRRFVKEAQALSALNHPHIVTIHELESAGEIDFIVTELVRGATLDVLIPKHGLRVGDLLLYAIPIADAVAAAHARGIIHRDLKPANIMLSDEGSVKVLDFGIAKLMGEDEAPATNGVTHRRTGTATAAGRIAGTPAYMAPEQLGGHVDARTDIFSFGAVLYEMATGRCAFGRDSHDATFAAVLEAQPTPPSRIVRDVPRELERLILRCLRKDPARRYQTMLDVRNELLELTDASRSASALPLRWQRQSPLIAAATIALIVLVVASISWWRNRDDNPAPRVVPLTTIEGWERMPTFSPDGEQVAFDYETGQPRRDTDIYVTLAGGDAVRRLTSDPAVEANSAWSPDGRHIAFVRQQPDDLSGRVYLISPLGGPDRKLSDLPVMVGFNGQISWSADSRFIAAGQWRPGMSGGESSGIYLIPTRLGEARRLTNSTMPAIDRDPAFAPDGRRLAYVACRSTGFAACDVMVVDLDAELTVRGAPRRLTSIASHIMGVAWVRDGKSLIFGTQAVAGVYYLWRVDSEGRHAAERLELPGLGAAFPASVPSRDRLAFARLGDNMDVYRVEAAGRSAPLVTSSFGDFQAVFSPDGRRLAFCSSRTGESVEIWVAAADGSGAQQLTHGIGRFQEAPRWSPGGRAIAFSSQTTTGQWHVWTIDVDGGTPRQVTRGAGDHKWPSWSGDGQRIYFDRDVGRGPNVWRIDLDSGHEEQITRQGGTKGVESADGKSLVYLPSLDPWRPLLTMPLSGGASRQLLACIRRWFFVSPRGIYYAACGDAEPSIRLIEAATGNDRAITTLVDPVFGDPAGLAISPDGSGIVYTRGMIKGSDVMLIENFR